MTRRTDAEWRPLTDAQKDGVEIILYFGPGVGVKSALWTDAHSGGWFAWCVDDNKHEPYPVRGYNEPYPNLWQPLPPAPKEKL